VVHLELVVAKLVTVVLGLAIAVTAYRGYHRHGAWPMLYLAVGFAIISVGSVVEGLLFDVLAMPLRDAGAIQAAIVAVGMVVVLYSLHADAPLWGIGASRDPPRRARNVDSDERSKEATEGESATEERGDER
jgi:hypothetical protein